MMLETIRVPVPSEVGAFSLYTKVRSRTRAKEKNKPTSQADSSSYESDSKWDVH